MEEKFCQLVLNQGLVTSEQLEECRLIQKQMQDMGLSDKIWQVLVDKKYLDGDRCRSLLQELETVDNQGATIPGDTFLEVRPSSDGPPEIPGYDLHSILGKGAMGAVYKAVQTSLNREVAVKILPPAFTANPNRIKRMEREARTLGRLNHPNIVSAIDFGLQNNTYYLVMEYIEGETLQHRVMKGDLFDEEEALDIILAIAKGLEHADKFGIIHRDIKPANIMIDKEGTPKLCDLGLVRQAEESRLTRTGGMLGTPTYMSPEQVEGTPDLDIRTDIFSLGMTLFNMVTGVSPYEGLNRGKLFIAILSEENPPIKEKCPHLSAGFVKIFEKMVARYREDRFQNPKELQEAIQNYREKQNGATISLHSVIAVSATVVLGLFAFLLFATEFFTKIPFASTSPPQKQARGEDLHPSPSSTSGRKKNTPTKKTSHSTTTGNTKSPDNSPPQGEKDQNKSSKTDPSHQPDETPKKTNPEKVDVEKNDSPPPPGEEPKEVDVEKKDPSSQPDETPKKTTSEKVIVEKKDPPPPPGEEPKEVDIVKKTPKENPQTLLQKERKLFQKSHAEFWVLLTSGQLDKAKKIQEKTLGKLASPTLREKAKWDLRAHRDMEAIFREFRRGIVELMKRRRRVIYNSRAYHIRGVSGNILTIERERPKKTFQISIYKLPPVIFGTLRRYMLKRTTKKDYFYKCLYYNLFDKAKTQLRWLKAPKSFVQHLSQVLFWRRAEWESRYLRIDSLLNRNQAKEALAKTIELRRRYPYYQTAKMERCLSKAFSYTGVSVVWPQYRITTDSLLKRVQMVGILAYYPDEIVLRGRQIRKGQTTASTRPSSYFEMDFYGFQKEIYQIWVLVEGESETTCFIQFEHSGGRNDPQKFRIGTTSGAKIYLNPRHTTPGKYTLFPALEESSDPSERRPRPAKFFLKKTGWQKLRFQWASKKSKVQAIFLVAKSWGPPKRAERKANRILDTIYLRDK